MPRVKVLIVEDDPVTAQDIQESLLAYHFEIAGVAYSLAQAQALLRQAKPTIALLDINLSGGLEGLELARALRSHYGVPFLFLTSYAHGHIIEQAKRLQPVGFILKPFQEKELFAAIEIGLYNFSRIPPDSFQSLIRANEFLDSPMTPKELSVLLSVYQGHANKAIAEEHQISINTVKTHLKQIFAKLQVGSRTEAVAKIRQWCQPQ
ncbi:response regulator transcription factor [Phaeodactylibacter luteus]|uniref:Response regulator transcription factor n=1 Tax=Phaeodactylibacter luteus TaxID=1564516 RepID=A0A5C6RYA8_9BACT|nr:DNA-binding response regulator [Phaeodactylibacter luteus]TXB67596.1 response regulator transcription factor [Phaeodactylibacter luteus]